MAQLQNELQEANVAKGVLNNLLELGELVQEPSSGNVMVADDPPSKKRPGRPRKNE